MSNELGKKSYRRGNLPNSIWPLLWDLDEEVYYYSARRLHDHAEAGRLLGIAYDSGQWIIQGNPRSICGPLPAKPSIYLKPKGATEHSVELASGSPISSKIWVKDSGKKFVQLQADISGAWGLVFYR